MSVLLECLFRVRQLLFVANALFYRFYLFLVFLSKPGAMWLVGVTCHVLVFWLYHRAVGWPVFDPQGDYQLWAQTAVDWLSYDHAARGWWIVIDVPLLAAGLLCQLFPPAILRAGLAMFPAKGRPLPPIRTVRAPMQKIVPARVKLLI